MKTPPLHTLLAAALLCIASPKSSPAADVVVDVSSLAPRDPNFVLLQIELNVAIKQYEKVLMEKHEARLQGEMGPTETGLTDQQLKDWAIRAERKLMVLEKTSRELGENIRIQMENAASMARDMEDRKARANAEPKADANRPKVEAHP
jgi:hypothetical protein